VKFPINSLDAEDGDGKIPPKEFLLENSRYSHVVGTHTLLSNCGKGGIRTHEPVSRLHALQACQFNRSCTFPIPRKTLIKPSSAHTTLQEVLSLACFDIGPEFLLMDQYPRCAASSELVASLVMAFQSSDDVASRSNVPLPKPITPHDVNVLHDSPGVPVSAKGACLPDRQGSASG
jgi:hypothetical protein